MFVFPSGLESGVHCAPISHPKRNQPELGQTLIRSVTDGIVSVMMFFDKHESAGQQQRVATTTVRW
ncbi:Centromere protein J [Anopheles sinensis]|uniref:Centromere protein J n=1 Tax=Anopheles sinensis TaxID=74873 RepID=A0A084VU79_ANOSI|nr:Centromere protein J [Anopheles sinensis]